jgi:aspartyl-tRNA(Asn)/glutamyl-tRNA(Gln) amidotransferase subunit A
MSLGDDVLFAPAWELSDLVRRRKVSPVELTDAYLERLERWGPRLNAVVRTTPELARAQAKQAQDELMRGRARGPLHGIPYGAKDLFATAGIPTEWGTTACAGQTFAQDATVVRKLREAGTVLLAKLAMIEFAGGLGYRYANASSSGPGRNPWNPDHWTGGSSSGSGAAVAAGLAPFALGTETWGSVLCPSAFCGLTGLRPTYGRVSRAGAMVCSFTFDKVGVLARSARDVREVMRVIAGADPEDPTSSSHPAQLAPTGKTPAQVRAALVTLDFGKGREPAARAAFDRAVADLHAMGLMTVEVKLSAFPTGELAGLIITAEALSTFEKFHRDGTVRQLKDPYAPYQWEINAEVHSDDLVKAWRLRREIQRQMTEFFEEYDVIVTPNFLTTAPRVDEDLNKALDGYTDPCGAIGNACGLPSLALPSGTGANGLPLGFQIMGAPFSEALLLDLGEAYQQRTHWHTAHPTLT